MDVIYGLIPGMIVLGLAAVAVLFWAARGGQFDDLDGDGRRILMDEDEVDPRRLPDDEPDPEPSVDGTSEREPERIESRCPRNIIMNAPSYETDYLRWLDTQAHHLRAGELDRLDREHLLEELESMSRSERRQLRNRLIVLVLHLLKMSCQPQRRSRSWGVTIITQRVDIGLLLRESPSLRPTLAATLDEIYVNARREAAQETGLDIGRFPVHCPFSIDQVLDDDYWPDGGREGN